MDLLSFIFYVVYLLFTLFFCFIKDIVSCIIEICPGRNTIYNTDANFCRTAFVTIIFEKVTCMLIFEAVVYEAPVHQAGFQPDESLFPRIAAGEKEAFHTLYETCSSSVFAFALSLLRHRDDAEDAMHDTFLKIRSAAHLYKPQGKPMAWIFTITRNICLMMYRKKAHTAPMPEEPADAPLGLDQIANLEDRLTLEKAFTVLPEDTCRIIMLHAVSGMKFREIADVLNVPLSTVLSKHNRGIKRLRKELEGIL